MPAIQILPSLLAADMGRLEEACRRAETAGADGLHLDIMDGHFVPNLSMGPAVVRMAKRCVRLPLNVHLMITNPDERADAFIEAGSHTLHIHVEAGCDPLPVLRHIRERDVLPGLAINPDTPADRLRPYLGEIEEVVCMTVHPGFGGQAFMEEVLPKIAQVRAWAPNLDIVVDGGLDLDTVSLAASHGANVFVAGTSLFSSDDMARDISSMRERARVAAAAAVS